MEVTSGKAAGLRGLYESACLFIGDVCIDNGFLEGRYGASCGKDVVGISSLLSIIYGGGIFRFSYELYWGKFRDLNCILV